MLTASSLALPALDVIIEGKASKVTDHTKVQQVVDAHAARLHWPLTVGDGGGVGPNAPTAGPPPYAVFELRPTTVVGLPGIAGTEEEGAPAPSARPAGGSKQLPTPPPLWHRDRHAVTVPAG